jgi:hypothetical protein
LTGVYVVFVFFINTYAVSFAPIVANGQWTVII